MTKTDSGVEVGRLSDRVEVLELGASFGSAKQLPRQPVIAQNVSESDTPAAWEWQTIRRTWAQTELAAKPNIYSVHGIGAAGVNFTLRRQPLDLDNALRWKGQHCLITAIRPLGRLYLVVEAALVVLFQCRNPKTGETFPAVMTERYVGHQQLEPMAVNKHQRILVTPKAVRLTPGALVEVDGAPWPIKTPYELDPYKNEYAIERTVDL